MKPSAVLSALLAVALPAVRGAALDRSRYCIYACPTSTSSGGIWVSSVRAGVLRCLYSDHASCLYSKTDGALVDDSSADACTPHAPQSCACELTCAGSSVLSAQVAGERTAATPDALVCTYARGLACAYHPNGKLIGTTSFCPAQADNSCRPARTAYAGDEGAQAALQRRFRVMARAVNVVASRP